MLKLYGRGVVENFTLDRSRLFTLTKNSQIPIGERQDKALIIENGSAPEGFGAYLTFDATKDLGQVNHLELPEEMNYIDEGDIARISPSGRIGIIFRKKSPNNTFLLTERCNHYCLMCSQPPKDHDDSWLMEEAIEALDLIPKDTANIGYTGGEPTLYGDQFIELITKTKKALPNTAIDVLTNGRTFKDSSFAKRYADVNHHDCLLGIPIYSDDPARHDYVVQANGAFDETMQGILNLKRFNQKVEIRVVIHKQTIDRLVQTCEFIARNLIFVDHVALMGLEMMGFTRANLDKLWIDPYEYKDTLSRALGILNSYGIRTSIYNHQLCVVNQDIKSNYVKSISDWKNEYVEECDSCVKRSECGGFFSSSKKYRYSDHIRAFKE
ncbi:His-Xaa-Ser system radical SAM maturase HxsC [Polynucleobacter sp. SHI8]|uniref:His-Xaa-Ser system radical SAM maturase HxsC n=1 Tax=unclassified Polynucleobacter TaxID=2640945 RepID=UPI0024904B80|nr:MULTISPECIES: His-Xaa-Ser system radical SAM maturase HxsC [unclassified Polynucleobacter]BDW12337.1 His-Xaa-Ser system radical SAM maturase HxsC [Polynucleobacter sp. SHI2]BDW14785.1 His-Xaa-Ser system radical SAM maturase HxsC [Polynucleobacter sp. SHI8]